ncbi:hypothetical protein KQX54_000648 [Cotesia glomerata]|uniref:Uncharacterized protein n=1 Tax=Cotesia glomerata TaxID=32391 RepID=A0AAV7IRT2_COTGL|nr:hypothetical protein KQX54_000648 [Cotesia glomerata]
MGTLGSLNGVSVSLIMIIRAQRAKERSLDDKYPENIDKTARPTKQGPSLTIYSEAPTTSDKVPDPAKQGQPLIITSEAPTASDGLSKVANPTESGQPLTVLGNSTKSQENSGGTTRRRGRPPKIREIPTKGESDQEDLIPFIDPEYDSDTDSDDSVESEHFNENNAKKGNRKISNIILVKDLFEYRNDNVVYFLDERHAMQVPVLSNLFINYLKSGPWALAKCIGQNEAIITISV